MAISSAEVFQPEGTPAAKAEKFEHRHLVACRIDRIYYSLPAWCYPNSVIEAEIFRDAAASEHDCGSDHIPVLSYLISRAKAKSNCRKTIP